MRRTMQRKCEGTPSICKIDECRRHRHRRRHIRSIEAREAASCGNARAVKPPFAEQRLQHESSLAPAGSSGPRPRTAQDALIRCAAVSVCACGSPGRRKLFDARSVLSSALSGVSRSSSAAPRDIWFAEQHTRLPADAGGAFMRQARLVRYQYQRPLPRDLAAARPDNRSSPSIEIVRRWTRCALSCTAVTLPPARRRRRRVANPDRSPRRSKPTTNARAAAFRLRNRLVRVAGERALIKVFDRGERGLIAEHTRRETSDAAGHAPAEHEQAQRQRRRHDQANGPPDPAPEDRRDDHRERREPRAASVQQRLDYLPTNSSTVTKSAIDQIAMSQPGLTAAASAVASPPAIQMPTYGTSRSKAARMPHRIGLGTPIEKSPAPIATPRAAFNPSCETK